MSLISFILWTLFLLVVGVFFGKQIQRTRISWTDSEVVFGRDVSSQVHYKVLEVEGEKLYFTIPQVNEARATAQVVQSLSFHK